MTVVVHLFAGLRDATRRDRIVIETDDHVTAADLIASVAREIPAAADLVHACRLAVDDAYVGGDHVVTADCRCDLIPPVSGG